MVGRDTGSADEEGPEGEQGTSGAVCDGGLILSRSLPRMRALWKGVLTSRIVREYLSSAVY